MIQRRIHILVIITFLLSASNVPVYSFTHQKMASHHPSMQSHAGHQSAAQSELTQVDNCCNDHTDQPATNQAAIKLCGEDCVCLISGCAGSEPLNTSEMHYYPAIEYKTGFVLGKNHLRMPCPQRPERVPIV
jgi:hypothetical protein